MRHTLPDYVAPGGILILSGILEEEVEADKKIQYTKWHDAKKEWTMKRLTFAIAAVTCLAINSVVGAQSIRATWTPQASGSSGGDAFQSRKAWESSLR